MNTELKMDDIVEVCVNALRYHKNEDYSQDRWEDRIFIKMGGENSVIVVHPGSVIDFHNGRSFSTLGYPKQLWRIKKEKTYRPFTCEELGAYVGKIILCKKPLFGKPYILITGCDFSYVYLGLGSSCNYRLLLDNYTFLDGSVCGVKE
jgi:hypothetical protein